MKSFLKKFDLLLFDTIDSTNEEAKRLIKAGVQGNFLIVADSQKSGRGQKGRGWQSSPGNMHISLLFETSKALKKNTDLVFLVANVIADVIETADTDKLLKRGDLNVKWPNDVLIEDKKVAGILIETIRAEDKQFIIVGVGVNVAITPNVKDRPVTSLKEAINYTDGVDIFMEMFVSRFYDEYTKWLKKGDFHDIRCKWLSRAYMLGQVITLDTGERRISGLFKNIDEEGNVEVELASGELIAMNYGEILFDGYK